MSERRGSSWREVPDIRGWELVILVPGDYNLITDVELTDPSGDRNLGGIGTPEMVHHIIDGNPHEGPFWMSDLVLTESEKASSVYQVFFRADDGDRTRVLSLGS